MNLVVILGAVYLVGALVYMVARSFVLLGREDDPETTFFSVMFNTLIDGLLWPLSFPSIKK